MGWWVWSLQKRGGITKNMLLTYAIILDIQGAVEENRLCCSCFIVLLFVSLSLLWTMESLDLGLLFFLEST